MKKRIFNIGLFFLIIGLSVLIFLFREKIAELKGYGYLGAFLISMVASATIVIPVPGWIMIAALALVFNPWLIGLLAGLGSTIGQSTAYFLGYSGQVILSSRREKIIEWMRKWGGLVIFFFSLIPNPLVDIVGAVAGLLKFPFLKFLFFCALGTVPKYILLALFANFFV